MDSAVTFIIEHLPSKRREEMRFFKTASVQKVICSACKLFKINPEEYELRYANKKLDPNLYLMFSRLPNGSYLELCPINKNTKDKPVVVNLMFGDETVGSGKFKRTATLWDVSQTLLPEGKFVEDERLSISCLSKNVVGPDMLKKVPLSSLKCEEGPLIISMNRCYSDEKLGKSSPISKNIQDKPSIVDPSNSKKYVTKTVHNDSKRFSNRVALKDMRQIQAKLGIIKSRNYVADIEIDKNFYLTPQKKLNDIKYLDSRRGFTYALKKPIQFGKKEESAVNLLDLRNDFTQTSNSEVKLKINLPDETVIQAIFKKNETLKDVFEYLNPLLQCQINDYFLYSMVSRKILEESILLKELEEKNAITLGLNLVPKAKRTWSKSRPYLKEDYLPKKKFIL